MGGPHLDFEMWESRMLQCRRALSAISNVAVFTSSRLAAITDSSTLALLRRELFERCLQTMRSRYDFVVAGYVVMPDHVHLLVSEPRKALLSKAIQALKLSVSVQSRQRSFWQARYYDFNVHNEEKRLEKLRYMHRNPVNRGLVERPEDWPWSSFRHYVTGLKGTVEIESQWTAFQRRDEFPEHLQYRQRAD